VQDLSNIFSERRGVDTSLITCRSSGLLSCTDAVFLELARLKRYFVNFIRPCVDHPGQYRFQLLQVIKQQVKRGFCRVAFRASSAACETPLLGQGDTRSLNVFDA
jgi:hypothetical protein